MIFSDSYWLSPLQTASILSLWHHDSHRFMNPFLGCSCAVARSATITLTMFNITIRCSISLIANGHPMTNSIACRVSRRAPFSANSLPSSFVAQVVVGLTYPVTPDESPFAAFFFQFELKTEKKIPPFPSTNPTINKQLSSSGPTNGTTFFFLFSI